MSFLRSLPKIVINRQVNTRAIYLAQSQQQKEEIRDEDPEDARWVDSDPKDRSFKVDVETSIRYMNSEAFKKSYGNNLIWTLYKRNLTRHYPSETRKKCIRKNTISTASPCPVCRDMYLVLDHRNIKLLEQFISPDNGQILPSLKTGLCQMQQQNLIVAVMRAREYGLMSYYIPFRHYNYDYYKELSKQFVKENKHLNQS